MAVLYRLGQNKNRQSKSFGKWFSHAVTTGVVDTEMLAEIMQRNCTLKKSDILAVISELVETMQDQLQNSKRVKLNGLGSFKLGISNAKGGADKAADFSVAKHIKALHVLFQPEVKTDTSGLRRKTFVTGCSVQPVPKNIDDTLKPESGGNGGGNNGGGSGSTED